MAVVTPSEAPTFDTGEATITGLASPSRGSTDTAAWRVRFAPDHPSPSHSMSREEIVIVVEGSLTAQFRDRGAPAEAICIMAVGGQATADGATFTPPWAE